MDCFYHKDTEVVSEGWGNGFYQPRGSLCLRGLIKRGSVLGTPSGGGNKGEHARGRAALPGAPGGPELPPPGRDPQGPRAARAAAWGRRAPSPCSPFPLALVQEGGGEAWGRTTGAKALFCFTAEMTLAGENEKMPCVLLQFEGRATEEAATVGLDGTTVTKQTCQDARRGHGHTTGRPGPGLEPRATAQA